MTPTTPTPARTSPSLVASQSLPGFVAEARQRRIERHALALTHRTDRPPPDCARIQFYLIRRLYRFVAVVALSLSFSLCLSNYLVAFSARPSLHGAGPTARPDAAVRATPGAQRRLQRALAQGPSPYAIPLYACIIRTTLDVAVIAPPPSFPRSSSCACSPSTSFRLAYLSLDYS